MELLYLLKGLIIGFAMAVPIGPIGIMCIRKTLTAGHARGLIIGLGAATADALYGCVAAFGLTFVSDIIFSQRFWLRLIGGIFLIYLGIKTYRAHPDEAKISLKNNKMLGSYISTFFLALTNPLTLFAFFAVFAAFGLANRLSMPSACILVLGVMSGSFLWFLSLSYVATFFRKKLGSDGLGWVNKISGAFIVASGIAAFISLL